MAYLSWAPPSYTGLDCQWVKYQVVIRSSAFWLEALKKKLRQDFSMSPVVQYSDLSWSPWLHTTKEGSVSHHNSFHLEPVGKNARKANSNLLVSQEGREAGRPANREGTEVCKCSFSASSWIEVTGAELIPAGSVGVHHWNHVTYALDGCEDWLQLVCMKCPTTVEVEVLKSLLTSGKQWLW